MLDQLRQIAIFAKTIECGSFVKAASALQLSPSVVSHHIAQLEKQLGVALIYRSTRKLSLTSDGKKLLASAQQMTKSGEEFINLAVNNNAELIGHLNITLPALMAKSALCKQIGDFVKLNPNVSLNMDFSDTQREMIKDGIDFAIRMGRLRDSNLKVRKLFDMERQLVVSAEISKQLTSIKSPKDLENEQWIEFSAVGLRYEFQHKTGEKITITPDSQIATNSIYAIQHFVQNSHGIAVLPKFIADEAKGKEKIVYILRDWQLEPISVYAVWPSNTPKHSLTKRLIDFLLSRNLYI
ncbi:MAG: LysR family transcriptional regulator [Arenicella sp.]